METLEALWEGQLTYLAGPFDSAQARKGSIPDYTDFSKATRKMQYKMQLSFVYGVL